MTSALAMAQSSTRIVSRSEFLVEVKTNLVDRGWTQLLTEDPSLCNQLNAILEGVHAAYEPKEDGTWKAAPKWTDMFQWTSCPLNSVRAVVLMKEPVSRVFHGFESTGYALSCRPKSAGAGMDLTKNTAVLNFLKIVCQAAKVPWDESRMCEKFRDGVDLGDLSRSGILFYNLGLTKGPKQARDAERWWSFSKDVLRAVGQRATGDVPVLQLYRSNELDQFLEEEEKRGRRLVLVKPRPWPSPKAVHVAFYGADDVTSHAAALRRMTYEALEAVREKLEDGEGEAKRVIVELHQQVSEMPDGRLNLSGTDRLVAVSQLQLEYMRLQKRLEPIVWLEKWLKT